MTDNDILAALNDIFQDVFDDPNLVVTPATTAHDVDGWDSFNNINIFVAAEMRFGLRFDTAELENLQNVGELVRLISRLLAEKR
ncbi:acyl carrier protein [Paraburkholderia sediminicola]|uniref:acyl carrier protein n=1 Tax=Paraburkholderia sediminicola TaxID=458836 RepID=UPI00094069CD